MSLSDVRAEVQPPRPGPAKPALCFTLDRTHPALLRPDPACELWGGRAAVEADLRWDDPGTYYSEEGGLTD